MPNKPTYSPEFREEAAKMVVESSRPIVQVAREIKVNEATLGGWVKRYRDKHADDGARPPGRDDRRLIAPVPLDDLRVGHQGAGGEPPGQGADIESRHPRMIRPRGHDRQISPNG